MLKRLAALSLVLVFASQALAGGINMCFSSEGNSHADMACCKQVQSGTATSAQMLCCEILCGARSGGFPGSQSTSSVNVPTPVISVVVHPVALLKPQDSLASALFSKRRADAPLDHFNPPDIYLQNNAFLI
jgi:hypothetical protein